VPETPTVTALLIDRSLGNSGCVAHKFFIICTEPQKWYQSRIYAYYACTVRIGKYTLKFLYGVGTSHKIGKLGMYRHSLETRETERSSMDRKVVRLT
jgi:hypothetical protein